MPDLRVAILIVVCGDHGEIVTLHLACIECGILLNAWQVESFTEGFVSIQASIVGRIHINREASKHLIYFLLEQLLINIVIHGFQIIEKRGDPFLLPKIDTHKMIRICLGDIIDYLPGWGLLKLHDSRASPCLS